MNKKVGERVILKRFDQCWTSGEIICIKDPYVKVRWKEKDGAIARKALHFSFTESLHYHVEQQQQPVILNEPIQQQQPSQQQHQPVTQLQNSVSHQQLVPQNHHLKLKIFLLLLGSLVYVLMDLYNFI
jgi:hypothetical protein